MKKTLRLRSEALAELSTADLANVAGAAGAAGAATYECTFPKCPSIDYCDPIPTTPVRVCIKN